MFKTALGVKSINLDYLLDDTGVKRIFSPRPDEYKSTKLGNKQWVNYYFAPPAQIFCLETLGGWLGIGLGDVYNTDGIAIDSKDILSLRFNGLDEETPKIVRFGGKNMLDILIRYGKFLRQKVKKPKTAEWHKRPIYCTWGDQMRDTPIGNVFVNLSNILFRVASKFGGVFERYKIALAGQNTNLGFGRMFNQRLDQNFVANSAKRIEEMGWPIGTIILDDSWMEYYGEPQAHPQRFPNINETIDYLHSKEFKVLAWYPNWWIHPKSKITKKHQDWVIKDVGGKLTYRFDITQSEVRENIKNVINEIIKDYGFDGLKLDFGYDSPSLTDRLAEPSFGVGDKLALKLQKLLYEAAHDAKEDALVIGISPNPFFAQYSDMIRLNDNFSHNISSQAKRALIAKALCPNHPIDSDGYNYSNKIVGYYNILSLKLDCVPSLYYCRNLGLTHKQEAKIKEVLENYEALL